jgi:hypothetical protein
MKATTAPGLAPTERPRLLFFYDERSGRSRRVEGFLAQVLQRRGNHETFQIHRVDVRKRPDLADRFRIESTPTLMVVVNKKVQARLELPRGCKDTALFLRPWLRPGHGQKEDPANITRAAP